MLAEHVPTPVLHPDIRCVTLRACVTQDGSKWCRNHQLDATTGQGRKEGSRDTTGKECRTKVREIAEEAGVVL